MNSIVQRLRGVFPASQYHQAVVETQALKKEAADLIEQQAERIKELEASLASMVQGVKISIPTQTMEQEFQSHYRRGYEAGKAALHQRIADAPVVAWMGEYNINDIRDHYTVVMRHKTDFDGMPERVRALVFKEDLLK